MVVFSSMKPLPQLEATIEPLVPLLYSHQWLLLSALTTGSHTASGEGCSSLMSEYRRITSFGLIDLMCCTACCMFMPFELKPGQIVNMAMLSFAIWAA